jgi:hypothetical protein
MVAGVRVTSGRRTDDAFLRVRTLLEDLEASTPLREVKTPSISPDSAVAAPEEQDPERDS